MDCRVDDGQIIPVRYRLRCDLTQLPESFPRGGDDEGLWAFSDADRDAITALLDGLEISYTIEPVDQPDPAHLAALQGKAATRTQALDALAALGAGQTPDILELRLALVEADVADLKEVSIQP